MIVAPVPGTGARYRAFALDPGRGCPTTGATMAPMGCLPGDFNEDGRMDVLVYYWGRPPVALPPRRRRQRWPRTPTGRVELAPWRRALVHQRR